MLLASLSFSPAAFPLFFSRRNAKSSTFSIPSFSAKITADSWARFKSLHRIRKRGILPEKSFASFSAAASICLRPLSVRFESVQPPVKCSVWCVASPCRTRMIISGFLILLRFRANGLRFRFTGFPCGFRLCITACGLYFH